MDEPTKDKDQLSDEELFDVTVRRDDTKSLDEITPHEVVVGDEVEKTTPETAAEDTATLPAEETQRVAEEPVVEKPVESAPAAPPVVAPAESTPAPVAEVHAPHNTGGTLVLQWLSYAFWGWFGFSTAVLSGITIGYFLDGKANDVIGGTLAYPLAAVIVMLLISLVTDFFYARHEPAVKTGAANVIMLIHVVLYLLVTVGAFITIMFAAISMFLADTNAYSDGHNGQKIAMLTATIVAIIFGGISFRALFGGKKGGVRKLFWLLMSVLALVAIVTSIVGPAARVTATRDDRLIEEALPTLTNDINEYVRTNDKLPASLGDVKSTGFNAGSKESVQQMISKNLVTYKPSTKPVTSTTNDLSTANSIASSKTQVPGHSTSPSATSIQKFYYQLCVTYKEEKNPDYYYQHDSYNSPAYVGSTVTTYSHPKGEKCYDVATSGKYSYDY